MGVDEFCCMQSDLHLINLQWKYALRGITWSYFTVILWMSLFILVFYRAQWGDFGVEFVIFKIWSLFLTETTMSHINHWDQVKSWKNLWKFWNGPLSRHKSGPFPQLNVAAYSKSSNSEARVKKLSQILSNNIDNGGRGIYVKYCLKIWMKIKMAFGKT